jgi:phage head maturation protease
MLKTISAALLAVSVVAAPAFAGSTKSATHAAPAVKSAQVKPGVLNANAKMGRHHQRHVRHVRHHRTHR